MTMPTFVAKPAASIRNININQKTRNMKVCKCQLPIFYIQMSTLACTEILDDITAAVTAAGEEKTKKYFQFTG